MAPNYNYNKSISNWKSGIASGKINVTRKPNVRLSLQEQMASLRPNNMVRMRQNSNALSRAINKNYTLNSKTKQFHLPSITGYMPPGLRQQFIKENAATLKQKAENRRVAQLNALRGIKRHTEASSRKNRKTRKNRR